MICLDIPNGDHCAVGPGVSIDKPKDKASPVDRGRHYRFSYKGVKIDPYRIMHVYGVTHPAHQHALKKLLRAGRSSAKGLRQDLEEVQMSIARWIEMLDEDSAP